MHYNKLKKDFPALFTQSELLHESDNILERPFLDDFSIFPCGNGTELGPAVLPVAGITFPSRHFRGFFHGHGPVHDRAGMIAGIEHYLIRIVYERVVEGLEEFRRFDVVVVQAYRRQRLIGPVRLDIFTVTLPEVLP